MPAVPWGPAPSVPVPGMPMLGLRPRAQPPAPDTALLPGITDEHRALWGHAPVRMPHALGDTGLFSDTALERLILDYPRRHYDLLHMAPKGAGHLAVWREGDLGRARPDQVLRALHEGRLWLNLRRVHEVDRRYHDLLEGIFAELRAAMPGFQPWRLNLGILISSPRAQVYYHADLPGQSLWQIRGQKRVFVYPNTPPFLPEDQIEGIVLNRTEAEIDYAPWFDQHARIFELKPGQLLHWPHNSPHRVENHEMLNVSVTTEHWTDEIRNLYATRYTNGLLRSQLGIAPGPPQARGLRVWPKAAVALASKTLGLLRHQRHEKRIEWTLDPGAPGFMREVTPWVLD